MRWAEAEVQRCRGAEMQGRMSSEGVWGNTALHCKPRAQTLAVKRQEIGMRLVPLMIALVDPAGGSSGNS